MAYRIIHSPHWEGCTALLDSRGDDHYLYVDLDKALLVSSDEITGEMQFLLQDGRVAWLTSTDLEMCEPIDLPLLFEPYRESYARLIEEVRK